MAGLGSGPGGVTALLHELGVPAFGVGLSPEMVALARETHPQLRFHTGSMTSLDIPSASLGGIPALYSTIPVPDARLPRVFAGFHRTLRPGTPASPALDYCWRTADQGEDVHPGRAAVGR
ncbi:methyltransferase domain-containing protein [Streptomyces sp. LaBMicrA B280]|uniref:methyltransferase domain-containing protein n=1 Tax=Streptomyces sp. LaBMicrA B280 TaxID=3391001 RepID=UPI003BA7729D